MIVVKAITPSPFRSSVFRREVMAEMTALHGEILNDYLKTAETWNHKPKFSGGVTMRSTTVAVDVHTDDEIYGYVTKGTPKHPIPKKAGAKTLRFRSKYKAKTTPRVIGSKSGGASGKLVFRKRVIHPGTKARKFDETINKKWKPVFPKRLQAALDRAAQQSGQGRK